MSFADALTCLAFSPDSQKVATGTARSGVTTTHIDADSKHLEMSAVTHTPVIVAWSSDGEKVMSASLDNMLHCWNTISSKLLGPPFQGHKELILAASFLRDSSHAISLSRDGELLMWDTGSGEITRQETLSKYAQTIFVATLSVDGSLLVTSDGKQGVAWEISRCVQVGNITLPDVPLLRAAIIPNSRHQVVLAFGDMSFWIWDTTTRDYDGARFEGLGGDAILSAMAVSPDGGLLAVEIDGINDYPTRFYDRKGHEFANSNIRCIHPFAFSPDGKKFAASRVRSDSKDGSHKLVIHAVEEILGYTGTSLDVPATTAPGDKGKQRAPSLPLAFFDELPRRSDSVEGRAPAARRKGTGFSSISVANIAEQASPRATGQKQSPSLSTILRRPWSHRARSIASSDVLGPASSPQALKPSPRQAGPSRAHNMDLQGQIEEITSTRGRRPVDASPSIPFKARRSNFSLFSRRILAHTVDVAPARDVDRYEIAPPTEAEMAAAMQHATDHPADTRTSQGQAAAGAQGSEVCTQGQPASQSAQPVQDSFSCIDEPLYEIVCCGFVVRRQSAA